MSILTPFIRLAGTAERYLDLLAGEEISRRERDKRWDAIPISERPYVLEAGLGTRVGSIARDLSRISGDVPIQGALRDELVSILENLKDLDNSASGVKAKALIRIGRRSADSDVSVGGS